MRAPLYSTRADEIFDPASIDDPHPLFARLRESRPLSRIAETGVHLVARWDGIEEVLRREADFSANLTGMLMRGPRGEPTVVPLPSSAAGRVIATADEPRHAVHRAIARPRLAPGEVPKLEGPIRGWVRKSVHAWLERGAGDFVPIAERVPARVVARVLGLPEDDVPRLRKWAMMGGDILAGDLDAERFAFLADENAAMNRYLGEHLDAAVARLRGGADAPLLHALARGVRDERIDREEAIGIAVVMFGAGGESTAALIGSVVRRLAERPDLARELSAHPDRIPRFVEEVVRLEPPFKFHYRAVRRECELAGFALRSGDRLMLLWPSANRDASRIEDPDRLRLDRRHPKNHLSFGRGGHFCIGATLARLEARVVCEELLAATGGLALSTEHAPVYAKSLFVRRHELLVLTAKRRSAGAA
ncbi:MAG: cytochrome P450 [Myxococcota bacterium]